MPRPFVVYYRREPDFTLDKKLTKAEVIAEVKHALLCTIYLDDLESVYFHQQGENWSPNGEARGLIESKGLHHTSMSVGDVVFDKDAGIYWQCASAGWEEIKK